MRLSLTPRENSFYEMFNRAAENNLKAVRILLDIVHGTGDIAEQAKAIRQHEHDGDAITHEVLNKLNKTFVTPFDREDIYRLTSTLDDIMDFVEAAADLLLLYEIDELPEETRQMVYILQKACVAICEGMPRLRGMKDVRPHFIEVNRLENEADKLYRKTVVRLFSGEYDTLTVMKLKDVVDEIESAVDACESLADAVETVVVKES